MLKSRTSRSSLFPGKAQSDTLTALPSADVGPWLATPRREGVRGWSCDPVAATPGTFSAAVRQQQNSPPTPSCSLEKPVSSVALGAASTLDFLVAEPASSGADVLSPQFLNKHIFSLYQAVFNTSLIIHHIHVQS